MERNKLEQNKKKGKNFFRAFLIGIAFFSLTFFSGCVPVLEVEVKADGGYTVSYAVALGEKFIDTISSVTGAGIDTPVFNADEFKSQLAKTGMKNIYAVTPALNAIVLSVPISAKEKNIFSDSKMISRNVVSGKNNMTLTLSSESLIKIYNALPEETRAYIDLFMAPVFTGETMTKDEYVELVSMVYGNPLAEEITDAKLTLAMSPPEKKNQKRFSVPLIDLLLMSKPVSFSVSW